jgi:HEAT repeat protein
MSVVRDLGRAGPDAPDRELRSELLDRCFGDSDADVRAQALLAAADLKARPLLDRVLGLLSDGELIVRQMAVLALGEMAEPSDEEIIGRIASLLRAGAPAIRYQALLAYAHLRPAHCASDLQIALTDSDREIQKLALRLVDEVLLPQQTALPNNLRLGIVAAAKAQDAQLSLLAQLLCGHLEIDASTTRLVEVVMRQLRVEEPRDEQWAIELCGRLQVRAAEPGLRRRAFGFWGRSTDPFRFVALGALLRLGDEGALGALKKQLTSRNVLHRLSAVQALGASALKDAHACLVEHEERLGWTQSKSQPDEIALVRAALLRLESELRATI